MKTYNIMLEMSNQDKTDWIDYLKSYTDAVNNILENILSNGIPLSLKLIHDANYYKEREKFPELPSQVIIKAEQESKSILASIKSNQKRLPEKTPIKKLLSLRLDKRLYSKFTKEGIFLSSKTKNKRIYAKLKLFPKVKELFLKYRILDPLIFERNGNLFLAVTFDIPNLPLQNNESLGVDLGIKRLVATSDGLVISGKEFNKHKRKIRYLKRCLQSKGTRLAKWRLNKLKRKEKNFSKNYTHLVANEILKTEKSSIVIEDLSKIKKQNKGKRFNNKLSQVPFYLLRTILTYKAEHIGKCVQTVNPAYTSKDDYRGLERGKRCGCRYYTNDGKVFDADVNASINILHKFDKHAFSFVEPIEGSFKPKSQVLSQQANRKFIYKPLPKGSGS